MASRHIRSSFILLGIMLACLLPQAVRGGNIHQSFGIDWNDPLDQLDDQAVTYRERWASDFQPVIYYLYHDLFSGAVLNEAIFDEFGPGQEFEPGLVREQLGKALDAWNGCSFSNFEFDDNLRWAETAFTRFSGGFNPWYTVKNVGFDGVNLITFQDEFIGWSAGEIGLTSIFILTEDFDLEEQRQFPMEVVEGLLAWVDFDFDQVFDVLLPLRKYKQGEYLDADILMNPGLGDFRLFPDDPDDYDENINNLYGTPDIQGVVAHELGHAHGVGHSFLWESTMQPFTSIHMAPPSGPFLGVNAYNQRTPNFDDFVAQAAQYPTDLPENLGAIAGQVINGDFFDGNMVPGDPRHNDDGGLLPFVAQVPVYLCVPAEQEEMHPDNTDWSMGLSGSVSSFVGHVAAFADQEGAMPMAFRRIASATTGLDMRVYVASSEDFSGNNPDAPPATVNGDFYMPGIPIRDDYAVFTDNPLYTNVNEVMFDIADESAVPGEFYGGANMPGLGSGFIPSNESSFDNLFGNNYIQAGVDHQGRIGIGVPARVGSSSAPLISGFADRVDRGFAVVKIDNKTFSTYEQAPGPVVNQMVIDDRADRATARWRIEHGEGLLDAPRGIVFKNDGKAFVSNGSLNHVNRYNGSSGIFETQFITEGIVSPRGLLFDKKGRFYVASEGTNQILRFNGITGVPDAEPFVDSDAGLDQPRGMIFDMNGDLLVTSFGNDRVLRFQGPDAANPGALVDVFIGPDKNNAGGLDGPNDLAMDNDGNLHVTSQNNNKVMRFYGPAATPEQQGLPRGFQGVPTDATIFSGNNLSAPDGILVAPNGDGIVASSGGDAVLIYDSRTGSFQKNLIAQNQGGLDQPTDIAFGPNDNYIYICSEGLGRVLQYDRRSGAFVKTFATSSGDVLMTFDARLSNAGGVELENNPRAANDVNITYRFQNTSSTPATIDLRQTYDLAILGKEGPIYFANNQQVTTTKAWTGTEIPKYLVFQDSLNNPLLKGVVTLTGPGTGGTLPNKLVLERVSQIMSPNLNVATSNTDIVSETGRLTNTGIAVSYGPVTLDPGETVDFGLMIGTLLDEFHVMKDGPFGTPDPEVLASAFGTVWEEDTQVAERIAALPGQVVDGITIMTDTGDLAPLTSPPVPPGTQGQLFSPENDRIPQREIASQDGVSTDIDNDGDLDIVLLVGRASGGQPSFNRLLENRYFPDGDLRFVDTTFGPDGMPGVGVDNLPPNAQNSMGVAAADFNNDGFVDLFFSNSPALGIGGMNTMYLNRGDGTFEDVTMLQPLPEAWLLPGMLDTDPTDPFGWDASMKPSVGDIDSDGDMDIVIPVRGGMFGAETRGMYQDILYTIPETNPNVRNFDGLYFQKPQEGGEAFEADEAQVGLAESPARVLVNQLQESGVMYFIDDTLGRDYTFGGFQPVGGELNYDNVDRMPPLLPEFVQSQGNPHEGEFDWANVALLGTFMGDASLDLLIGESSYAGGEFATNYRLQPNLRVYNNFDVDEDLRPDGYFAQVNWGMDFNMFPLDDVGQSDYTPYFIGIPNEFPDSDGPTPASTNRADLFPNLRFSINALAIADLSNQGIPSPITALTTGDSYYFPRKFRDRTGNNNELGAKKGYNGFVTGIASDFDLQISPFHMTLSTIADRYNEEGFRTVELPEGAPVPKPYFPGEPWDLAEDSPFDSGEAPDAGDESDRLRYDIPENIGRWTQELVATGEGYRTRDIVAADFDRDGDIDLFYANDRLGGDSTLGNLVPVANSYFANNGDHTFTTDLVATTLALEEVAESVGAIPGDYDNDGDMDLYICNPGDQDHLLRNTTFNGTPNLTSSLDAPMFYDATVDFLPPYWGVSEPPLGFGTFMNMTYSTAVADLNCDGRMDLYVGNGGDVTAPIGDSNMTLFNSGEVQAPGIHVMRPPDSPYPAPGLLQPDSTLQFPTPTTGVAAGDLDNDGDYDLVDVNYQVGPRVFFNEDFDDETVNFMPDFDTLGDGVFLPAPVVPVLENITCGIIGEPAIQKVQNTSVALGDLDGDGDLDMVVGNGATGVGAPNLVLMNELNTTGMFVDVSETDRLPRVMFDVNAGGTILDCIQGISDDTRSVIVADFTGDGHLDIFFGNSAVSDSMAPFRLQPDGRSDGMIGCRLLVNHEQFPDTGLWGYFVDETEQRLPAPFRELERSNKPIVGTVKAGDFDGAGDRSEDINYNGVLDCGIDLDGDGWLETGEDSFFSYLSANRGSIANDNGVLDFEDADGNGAANLSLDIFIGFENAPDYLLMNDGTGHFTDGSNQLPNSGSSIDTRGADIGDVDLDGDLDMVLALNTRGIENPGGLAPLPTALILNDGSGSFSDASYEIPFPDSILSSTVTGLLNDIRDVDFIDFDNDGDLDLFVSVAGDTESIQLKGYLNYVMINRMIGSNWNAERTTVAQIPGKPVIRVVSPPWANPGTTVQVLITGANFEAGSTFDFGSGVSVVGEPNITSTSRAMVTVSVAQNAAIGPRTIRVTQPSGREGVSALGAFNIITGQGQGNAVRGNAWMLYESATPDNSRRAATPGVITKYE